MNVSSCHLNHKFKTFNMIPKSTFWAPTYPLLDSLHSSLSRLFAISWAHQALYYPKADACVVPSAWNNYLSTLQLAAIHPSALGYTVTPTERPSLTCSLSFSLQDLCIFLPQFYHELWSCVCVCVSLLNVTIVFVLLLYFLSPVHYLVHKNDP